MAEPFIAEIRIYPYTFAPRGWSYCNGQLLPLAQNTALFSLLGTNYGGDGKSNFALPNLQGSAPMHWGDGPGLSPRVVGETSGSATVTLLTTEMPQHNHGVTADDNQSTATGNDPTNAYLAQGMQYAARGQKTPIAVYAQSGANPPPMNAQEVAATGGSQPHDNMQPYLGLNFCIALTGIFPSRN